MQKHTFLLTGVRHTVVRALAKILEEELCESTWCYKVLGSQGAPNSIITFKSSDDSEVAMTLQHVGGGDYGLTVSYNKRLRDEPGHMRTRCGFFLSSTRTNSQEFFLKVASADLRWSNDHVPSCYEVLESTI